MISDRPSDTQAPRQEALLLHFIVNDLARPSMHFVQDCLSAAGIILSIPAEIAMRQERCADFPALAGIVEMIWRRPVYQRATVIEQSSQTQGS